MISVDSIPVWMRVHARPIMVSVIILTLGFVGFVLTTQVSLIEEAHSQSQSSYSLSHDITTLRTQWSQSHAGEVRAKIEQAEQMLLRDFDHLALWLRELDARASTMQLRTKYRVQPVRKTVQDLSDVEMIPVDLEVFPEDPAILPRAFTQYLQFLRSISEDKIRVDLEMADVDGGRGAAHMKAVIHVWMKVNA